MITELSGELTHPRETSSQISVRSLLGRALQEGRFKALVAQTFWGQFSTDARGRLKD